MFSTYACKMLAEVGSYCSISFRVFLTLLWSDFMLFD